jgi:hypothetical protein
LPVSTTETTAHKFHGGPARRVTAVYKVTSMNQATAADHELIEPTEIVAIRCAMA